MAMLGDAHHRTQGACKRRTSGVGKANRTTIASYEACAAHYACATQPEPNAPESTSLGRFMRMVRGNGYILEIGSGPGWDADWLERNGLSVRRTDAAAAFVEFQRSRGATAELLDVTRDELGGPYGGIVALYVFQHIDRSDLPRVFTKISSAIAVGGALLLSLSEGEGELVERGSGTGAYHIAKWRKEDLIAILRPLGFQDQWSQSHADDDGRWLTILATKRW